MGHKLGQKPEIGTKTCYWDLKNWDKNLKLGQKHKLGQKQEIGKKTRNSHTIFN